MKSIILKPHELANIDRLAVVVRPFKKQPSEEWTPFGYGEVHKMVDGEFVQPLEIIGWGPCNESGSEAYISPFSPGETVFVKETYWIEPTGTNFVTVVRYCSDMQYGPIATQYCDYAKALSHGNSQGYYKRSARSMPQWAARYRITFKGVEAKQAKALSDEEIRGNCIKPDMVDSGGQNPDGSWINIADYGHPFLDAYKCTPDTWLWLWKVEVEYD